MLRIAVIAIVATVSAVGAAKTVVALDTASRQPAVMAQANTLTTAAPAAPGSADAAIVKAADGHYWAEATVNGKAVRFLVDTGATAVALTPADAERLGLTPADLHYSYRVVTAGGQARAASVKLTSITVAGARLDNVDALVIERGLDTSLLGMSYLGRLSRFEATRQSLVLTP